MALCTLACRRLADCITIDCRQVVTALAFVNVESSADCIQMYKEGSGYRVLRWEQYSQVLAVGLRNGRIRVFDVNTGKCDGFVPCVTENFYEKYYGIFRELPTKLSYEFKRYLPIAEITITVYCMVVWIRYPAICLSKSGSSIID